MVDPKIPDVLRQPEDGAGAGEEPRLRGSQTPFREKPDDEKPEPLPELAVQQILGSKAAADIQWFFQDAEASLGIHASNAEGGGGGSASDSSDRKNLKFSFDLRHRGAVRRERRVRWRLARLTSETYRILQIAYESKRYSNRVKDALGVFVDLAIKRPRLDAAYRRYCERFTPETAGAMPLHVRDWLEVVSDPNKQRDDTLKLARADADRTVAEAVRVYQAVPAPPEEAKLTRPPPPKPRASSAAKRIADKLRALIPEGWGR